MSIFSRATVVSIKDYGDNIKEFILKLDNYAPYPLYFLLAKSTNRNFSSLCRLSVN